MKIEDITTEVRPRSPWESIDLGLRMVQTWSKPIILSWLLFVLPVCIVIYIVLYQYPVWSVIIIWWLKPLFDRIPLYIVSHSVFGDIPSVRDIRKALFSIIRPHIIKTLLWYRLDPVRSFNLPVWQLEGLKGKFRAKRARVLQKGVYGTAVSLTYFCVFIQIILWLACYALLTLLLPTNVSSNGMSLFSLDNDSFLPGLILNIFAFISLSIIEPLYVAGGFALYLNRRTHLEAWDIELKFRSLAKRMVVTKEKSTTAAKVASVLVLVLFFANSNFTVINPVQAKTAQAHYSDMSNERAHKILKEVLASDEFNTKIKTRDWRLKEGYFENWFKDRKNDDIEKLAKYGFLSELISTILGNILYFLLGGVVLLFVIYLVFKLAKHLPKNLFSFSRKKTKEESIKTIFGLDLDPESLPDDVGTSAWALWQDKKFSAALSLLYRGSLSKLVIRDGVKLPSSATEGDCIKILKKSHVNNNKELVTYFETLTSMWQRAAYAHCYPELADVKNICDSWSAVFQVKPK